jgi:predicted dehydrogenase
MNILFLGLGSIGQRHLQNIQEIYGNNFNYFTIRGKNHNNYIKDGVMKVVYDLNDFYGLTQFTCLDEVFTKEKVDIVYITNPTSYHFPTILNTMKEGCSLFVEKPVCQNISEAKKLLEHSNRNSLLYVGYQTKFDPLYLKLKKIIQTEKFGKLVSFRSEWCTYLPNHHKYEDYKHSYAAKRNLGGGVLLGLSHELDILIDLFGLPNKVSSIESKNDLLEIDADDTYTILCKYNNHNKNFGGTLNLSYSQIFETRFINLHYEEGFISVDFVKRSAIYKTNEIKIAQKFIDKTTRNEIFKNQTISFIEAVKNKDLKFGNLKQSLDIMAFIKKIKEGII